MSAAVTLTLQDLASVRSGSLRALEVKRVVITAQIDTIQTIYGDLDGHP